MIFTRVVPALLVAVVSPQALYIPDVAARELASNNEVTVLSARHLAALGLRSEGILSHILVTCTHGPLPSPRLYEYKSKADCQTTRPPGTGAAISRWQAALNATTKGNVAYRTVKKNLHSCKNSREIVTTPASARICAGKSWLNQCVPC